MTTSGECEPLLKLPASLNDSGVWWKLLTSHTITRLGTQAWVFTAPLVLTRFTPGSILGPSVWGMVTMLSTVFFGPHLGAWADRTPRNAVITCGVMLQFVAVSGATVVIFAALTGSSAQGRYDTNWLALGIYSAFGAVEKLGMLLSDVSVRREWTPQLFSGDVQREFNSRMSQIDLSTEVVGPFIAGLLITFGDTFSSKLPGYLNGTDFGFVVTGFVNLLTFFPQLALLRSIYHSHSEFLQPVPKEKLKPAVSLFSGDSAWGTWWNHPGGLMLLSSSYALLYLTVLSPHGALFTAFLMLRSVPAWLLSLVRGAGALLGILGTMGQPGLVRQLGGRTADAFSVCWLAAWVLVALLAFTFAAHGEEARGTTRSVLVFMAAVCMGRPGLYAFEVGVLNQEQELVDKRHRSAVGAVDTALTSVFTLLMYSAGVCFDDVAQFGVLVYGSSFFVSCGAGTYLLWTALYKSRRHRHLEDAHSNGSASGHGHSHGHGHGTDGLVHHEHTLQMLEMKESTEDGGYVHEHIMYEPGGCTAQ